MIAYPVVYAMWISYRKLKYALSHDRIYRSQSHDIVLKSHAFSGNSIESSIANLVFDFDNALKFQSASICTNEIYVYTEFGHPFGYSWFVHEICLDRFNT
jgi:hypothetical protein